MVIVLLIISKPAKFESYMLEMSEDIALQNRKNFTDVCMVGGT